MDSAELSFGSLLRRLRMTQRLSQEELAERAKMSAAAISALERGSRRAPYRSSVDLLANGLGIEGEARNQLHSLAERWRKARALPTRGAALSSNALASPGWPNNLPSPISSFIGRKKELEDLGTLIAECRLLTIVGPGGIGKTRLALKLAANVLERYRDGAWFVDLTVVNDPDLIAQAVATGVGLRELPNEPIDKTLTTGLSDKNLLLVIDNAEHLLAGVAKLVKSILLRCPAVALATTSREPLHVLGEQVYRLGSLLAAPAAGGAAALSRYDSTRLFLERAHEAAPSVIFGDAECSDVISLCVKLEGVPLAIELACARLSSMTLTQLARRLTSSLTLASKDTTDTSRHRTLRETIAWSYQLLSPNEKIALMALSVFHGSCTGDAIRAVASAVADIDDAVDSLVDKSLLQVDDSNAEERYRLLDIVREYGYERLQASGGYEAAARDHATYYANVASAPQAADLSGPRAQLHAELDNDAANVRAALEWNIAHDAPVATKLVLALAAYWRVRGAVTEARSWISRALEAGPGNEEARASLLCLAASFATMQDELAESLRLSHEALDIYRRTGNRPGAAKARFRIAEAEHRQGHLNTAETLYQEALEGFTASGDARGEMVCIGNLGMISRQRGDLRQASALLDDATKRASFLGEERIVSEFTMAMGWVQLGLNDLAQSQALFERAFGENSRAQDPYGICSARHGLATVALKQGRSNEALKEFLATLLAAKELQLKDYVARALHGIAAIQAVDGDVETAARFLGLADRLFEESGRELRDSLAYDIAAKSIDAIVPDPRRSALLQEGAQMQVSDVLTILRTNDARKETK